jgi:hypothetical protein
MSVLHKLIICNLTPRFALITASGIILKVAVNCVLQGALELHALACKQLVFHRHVWEVFSSWRQQLMRLYDVPAIALVKSLAKCKEQYEQLRHTAASLMSVLQVVQVGEQFL